MAVSAARNDDCRMREKKGGVTPVTKSLRTDRAIQVLAWRIRYCWFASGSIRERAVADVTPIRVYHHTFLIALDSIKPRLTEKLQTIQNAWALINHITYCNDPINPLVEAECVKPR